MFGSSRAMWIKHREDIHEEAIELQSCVHATKPDSYCGYMRLGRSGAPDPARTVSIPVSGQTGSVRTLTWDENSGRASLFLTTWKHGYISHELLVVDMLP